MMNVSIGNNIYIVASMLYARILCTVIDPCKPVFVNKAFFEKFLASI